jgi:hypothetical protein
VESTKLFCKLSLLFYVDMLREHIMGDHVNNEPIMSVRHLN